MILKSPLQWLARVFVFTWLLCSVSSAIAADLPTPATPAAAIHVVAFYHGVFDLAHINFVHEANRWFPKMGPKYGFSYAATQNWGNLNREFLSKYQVVLFLDDSPHDPDQRAAFRQYMENGGGWMGFHVSAFTTDPKEWDWYYNVFLGSGAFHNNTWFPTTAVLKVEDRNHPAMKGLPAIFTSAVSEWYSWENDLRKNPDIDILASVDPSCFPLGTDPNQSWYSGYYPILWSNRKYRMIYANFGHNAMNYKANIGKSSTFASADQDRFIINSILWLGSRTPAAHADPPAVPPTMPAWRLNPNLPTIFLAGDSTAQNGDPKHTGWGKPFAAYVDPSKANWVNAAIGGRSSRTYVSEGRWARVESALKPGDFVFIQFGHNDGGGVNFRGSLPGVGDETVDVENPTTHVHQTVHTYGYYMKLMIEQARAKDAIPIVVAVTPRNIWSGGHVERAMGHFNEWAKQIAIAEHVAYIDLTDMVADRYEQMGPQEVKNLFPADHTHTGPEGAAINAECVLAGIKALHRQMLLRLLAPAALDVEPATQPSVVLGRANRGAPGSFDEAYFLNVQEPADPKLPSIILIGDSTVRNGRGDGANGQWGWGEALRAWIDPHKANLVNRALGGTTAGSFMRSEWPGVLEIIKPGDVVLIQFGTNDDGPPVGIGDEIIVKPNRDGSGAILAHTFGWYLRRYITDIRGKGATPVLCALVPRNVWRDGQFAARDTHAEWARQVATDQKVDLLDLYAAASNRYASLGEKGATALFADGRVHTNHEGAEALAAIVVAQSEQIDPNPLAGYLRDKPQSSW